MRLLERYLNSDLHDIIPERSSDDDQPRLPYPEPQSPTIVWAAETTDKKLFLVRERDFRLVVVISFFNRPEYEGVEAVAEALLKEGIVEIDAAMAHVALPGEIREQIRIMRFAQSTNPALTPGTRQGRQLRFNFNR